MSFCCLRRTGVILTGNIQNTGTVHGHSLSFFSPDQTAAHTDAVPECRVTAMEYIKLKPQSAVYGGHYRSRQH